MLTELPRLPEVDLEIILEAFHATAQSTDLNQRQWGDKARLQEIGVQVLHMALTAHYFSVKPNLSATEIQSKVSEVRHGGRIHEWVGRYDNLIRFVMDKDSPAERGQLFEAYVGALWYSKGMKATQKWISDLLGDNVYVKDEPDDTAQDVTGDSSQSPPQYSPTATTTSGPPHPSVAPAIPLAHVNELAAQRKINMTWEASFSGPPHMPIWTVRCLVNGQSYGEGTNANKKKAQAEAASNAYWNCPAFRSVPN
ncbi:hypothetical protein CC1G_01870 [Coprinopsis cinerea okayama7|uniref:DRBM domain-containing protein n=1 Tax=Coprinopsis cinerea (strain Okayama-7 / 130 / ATCC MYA-4618 / FGSC 9003) TaxID=240176 RepID=A8N2Q6_COPC7|nr:hypothetical protein CC1G_01870 [Coprinopsis cinerea okayama7\|eukprot:XP_001829190.2 hypothetical protein CC1G_01870 [Coprinopsis cinerea okayama7\